MLVSTLSIVLNAQVLACFKPYFTFCQARHLPTKTTLKIFLLFLPNSYRTQIVYKNWSKRSQVMQRKVKFKRVIFKTGITMEIWITNQSGSQLVKTCMILKLHPSFWPHWITKPVFRLDCSKPLKHRKQWSCLMAGSRNTTKNHNLFPVLEWKAILLPDTKLSLNLDPPHCICMLPVLYPT